MNTTELARALIDDVLGNEKFQAAADLYARTELDISPNADIVEDPAYLRAFNEFAAIALARMIVLIHPSI